MKRASTLPAGSGEAISSAGKRCTPGVTPLPGDTAAQPSDPAQFLTPSGFSEFQSLAQIIQREKLLTSREVAEILGVSRATLHGWRGRTYKRGPQFIRISGTRVRYRLRDLRAWLDKLGAMGKEGR